MNKPMPPDVAREMADYLYAGNKIGAIKRYREHSGKGLQESKELVEALEAELRARDPSKFIPVTPGKGCLGTSALFGLMALAVLLVAVH